MFLLNISFDQEKAMFSNVGNHKMLMHLTVDIIENFDEEKTIRPAGGRRRAEVRRCAPS
ncbi:hypothetical protein AB4225_36530 [Streptomyces sp. 2RAF24]|uniref:hypothetical protein n=1 Tax=Streptomyces sp. 2RAF24 TaxID=3232997 RepID=UPI003F969DB0